jgi:hypothetical protein
MRGDIFDTLDTLLKFAVFGMLTVALLMLGTIGFAIWWGLHHIAIV